MLENEKKPRTATGLQLFLTVAASVVAMVAWFFWLGGRRNVDGDEGLYLEAARLVMSGKSLYSDFFFQQMPLTPYLYGLWMKFFGSGFLSARHCSAILTAATGAVMLAYVARSSRSLFWVNAAGLMFFANGIVLAWAPVVKTHPLTMFALVASAVAMLEWRRSRAVGWLAAAGLLIGIGIGGRLTLGPLAVFYFAYVAWDAPSRRIPSLAVLALSVLLASTPVFYFFAQDPAL
ncbi:MAG TPA: glycosyltransferase family 39 protein, partial [bacterium]|nr:glycosyltransferase family 39 protein [bacterium]